MVQASISARSDLDRLTSSQNLISWTLTLHLHSSDSFFIMGAESKPESKHILPIPQGADMSQAGALIFPMSGNSGWQCQVHANVPGQGIYEVNSLLMNNFLQTQAPMTFGMMPPPPPVVEATTPECQEWVAVNPKQYYRILKRRVARAKLEELGLIPPIGTKRKPYLCESRRLHALGRKRGPNGKFLDCNGNKATIVNAEPRTKAALNVENGSKLTKKTAVQAKKFVPRKLVEIRPRAVPVPSRSPPLTLIVASSSAQEQSMSWSMTSMGSILVSESTLRDRPDNTMQFYASDWEQNIDSNDLQLLNFE